MFIEAAQEVPPQPHTLYKYYPPERFSIFESPSLRFTSPILFNDTFDSHSPTVMVDGKLLRPTRSNIGIFCTAGDPDDHLMWVHYAAQRTGFVVGFDTSDDVFRAEEATLDYVRYGPIPTPFPTGIRHCFHKGLEWKYEKEWRCVRLFAEDAPRDVPIKRTAFKEVIIGDAMKPYHVIEIIRHLRNGFNAALHVIHVDTIGRCLRVLNYNAGLCPTCNGLGLTPTEAMFGNPAEG